MFYDVEPFWFYVLVERKRGDVFTTVGYFSKEKNPVIDYNLSCIMVLPAFMGRGYGKFRKSENLFAAHVVCQQSVFKVIDLSYAVSRQEGIFGSPERPLSDLGLISYRSYWKDVIVQYILTLQPEQKFSVRELSLQSGILQNDIVSTLQFMQVCYRGRRISVIASRRKSSVAHLSGISLVPYICGCTKFLTNMGSKAAQVRFHEKCATILNN